MVAKLTNTETVDTDQMLQGVIVTDPATSTLGLNVYGNIIPFRCVDPLVLAVGDTVIVDFVGGKGQSEAWIIGRLGKTIRPNTGTVTVVPPSSPTITVAGDDGGTYRASFGSNYTPTVGDNVQLLWGATVPYVVAKVGSTAVPQPPPTPPPVTPPAQHQTGTTTFVASDSGTYTAGYGWDRWAQQNNQVYSGGAGYGGSSSGAWFYAGSIGSLAGRTINAMNFRFGSRLYVGSYNSTANVALYVHNSPNKPGGDVSRVAGPFNIPVFPGQGAFTIDIPGGLVPSFAAALIGGGGFSISGEPYFGCNGRNVDPSSGTTQLAWST